MFLNTDTSICLIIPIAQILCYNGRVIFLLVLGGFGLSYLCLGDGSCFGFCSFSFWICLFVCLFVCLGLHCLFVNWGPIGAVREHWLFIVSLAFCDSNPPIPIPPTPHPHPSPPNPTTHHIPTPHPTPPHPPVSYGYSLALFPLSDFRFVWGFCSYLLLDFFHCSRGLGVSSSYIWILVDVCLPGGILASFTLPFFHGLCSLFVGCFSCFSSESTLFSSLWACLVFFSHDVS